ncbi:hypothetical protein DFR49_3351 [Hephaestia caeni]|uniref:Uncharacterized protein n=1 Tax=Hephaestia caeni TaxID=645617 RepID=A0A397NIV3_9SPHN|nr:hypothetical protein [Hephaestia caeni]RIA37466.1 hypothetical protein DFR49_3351 [Hephaestia caeni]
MDDIKTMTAAEIAALTPAELAAYSAADLGELSGAQVGGMTTDQIVALDAEQLAAIADAIGEWQTLVGAYQSALADAAAAERATFLAPLTDILTSDAFATVKTAVEALDDRYAAESFNGKLRCLVTGVGLAVS